MRSKKELVTNFIFKSHALPYEHSATRLKMDMVYFSIVAESSLSVIRKKPWIDTDSHGMNREYLFSAFHSGIFYDNLGA